MYKQEEFDKCEEELLSLGMSQETIDTVLGIYGTNEDVYRSMRYYIDGDETFSFEEEEDEE